MADPFIGEIRPFCFNYAPRDWALCVGSVMPVPQFSTLFALLGATYGGNGTTNFNLPDLRGQAAMGMGQGPGLTWRDRGDVVGSASVTLLSNEMPVHDHDSGGAVTAVLSALTDTPSATTMLSRAANTSTTPASLVRVYSDLDQGNAPMSPAAVSVAGDSQPHENRQPFVALNYCIALEGVWPPHP